MRVPERLERLFHVIGVTMVAFVLCYGQDATTLLLFIILALDLIAYLKPEVEKSSKVLGPAIE